jgi:phage-related minor tail protein
LRKFIPALGLTKAAMGPIVLSLTLLTAGLFQLANASVEAKRKQEAHEEVLKSLNEELIKNTIETEENTRTALINAQTWWENRKFLPFASIQYGKLSKKIKDSTERLAALNKKLEGLPAETAADKIKKASEAMGALKDITAQTSAQFQESFAKKMQQYGKTVNDFGGQVGEIVTKSFRGMEDALVRFVQTGKMNFREFANSIIADMIRIAVRQRIIAPLMNSFSSWLGNKYGPVDVKGQMGGMGAVLDIESGRTRAKGGPVRGGSSYLVGEKGPELFVPGSSGNIVPNHQMGGANVVINVDASGSEVQGNEGQAAMLGRAISSAVTEEIARQKRPGGLLSAA